MKDKKVYSIHARLIFFYSLTVVSLLVLLALAFYWETQNLMHQADYTFVADEASNIQSILADDDLDEALLKKVIVEHPIRTRNSLYRYYIRVIDQAGKVYMSTPGFDDIMAVSAPQSVHDHTLQSTRWHTSNGSSYLVMVAPVKLHEGKQDGYVEIALDTSYQHIITHDRRIFFGFLFVSMIVSLLLAKVVTSRGLRSLDILAETVQNISTSSLHKRVDPERLPSELFVLAKSLNQMLDRIEHSFERMHRLSADMSHELRTPVNNLIGQTELLLSCQHSEADMHNALVSNLEELQRMTSLIENILFLARAEGQLPDIEKHDIDAMAEVEKVCEYYQALADDKSIRLEAEGQASTKANKVMFRRLLSNLISNAIKYSGNATVIRITVAQEHDKAKIVIVDQGMGIEAKHLPRLFDRFYRVDDARSAQVSGTGLGLSIVKSIIDLHHGHINIESLPGLGTRIEIIL